MGDALGDPAAVDVGALRVLDVATGTADLALAVSRRPHQPRVVGLDLVPAMLRQAQGKLKKALGRVCLLAGAGAKETVSV